MSEGLKPCVVFIQLCVCVCVFRNSFLRVAAFQAAVPTCCKYKVLVQTQGGGLVGGEVLLVGQQ